MFNKIYNEDCITGLAQLPDNCIDCCVTSPPYWGLRDYGCDGQIGLEETPEEYVFKMVVVFHEVKRVLKDGGNLWLNLGDSYAGSGKGAAHYPELTTGTKQETSKGMLGQKNIPKSFTNETYKPKDLVGIPWMVAFALRADGWYLRQDIIWHKPNPMPESVTDRCTKSHEYIFLMSKSAKYYYDADAIKDMTNAVPDVRRRSSTFKKYQQMGSAISSAEYVVTTGCNKRDVWSITTKPFAEAHFATYPEELIEPCILAGCPEDGIVLDPFMGSGTTSVVAVKNNRQWVGFELNKDYIKIAEKRISVADHNKKMDESQITVFDLNASATFR